MAELERWAVVGVAVLALAACRDPEGVADRLLSKHAPGAADVQDKLDAVSEPDAAAADAAQVVDTTPDVAPDSADAAPGDAPDAKPDAAPDDAPDAKPDAVPDDAPDAEPDAAPDVAPDVAAADAPETAPDVPAPLDSDAIAAAEDAASAAETTDAQDGTAAQDAGADAAPDTEPNDVQADLTVADAQLQDGAPTDLGAIDAEDAAGAEEIGADAVVELDAGPACTVQTCAAVGPCWICDPAEGCVAVADQSDCSDGDACSSGDHCQGGICLPVGTLSCDDGNVCTDDACQKASGCSNTANAGACEDGSQCTVADACSGGVCIAGSVTACDDENGCTTDTCDPATGCLHAPNTLACQDGNSCTAPDQCSGGVCVGGQAVVCSALDGCHVAGSCDPTSGLCANPAKPDGSPCSDDLVCTTQSCQQGSCQATAVTCPAHATCSEPSGCACQAGYIGADVNGSLLCAPDFPAWGNRPEHPDPAWFEQIGDGTVKDSQTGLFWQQASVGPGYSWSAAKTYCQDLVLGDGQKNDWRLPTIAEMLTLVDYTAPMPTVVGALAPTTAADAFWTANPAAETGDGWAATFNYATTYMPPLGFTRFVRCVSGVTEPKVWPRYTPKSGGVVSTT